MFEVGQKVWDVVRGGGRVVRVDNDFDYPVAVDLDCGRSETYTSEGKYAEYDVNVSLYLYPVEVVKKVTKPSIDWNHVHSRFKWVAQDSDGGCWLYEEEPIETIDGWKCTKGDCTPAEGFISLTLGTCDWKDSLVVRPEGA